MDEIRDLGVGGLGEALREGFGPELFKDLERRNVREGDCLRGWFQISESTLQILYVISRHLLHRYGVSNRP